MKVLINFFLSITLITALFSCSAIFEEPIDDEHVIVITPGDSTKSLVYGVTFWWNPVEDATKYNLQIVSPNFNDLTSVILDTNIAGTKFTYSLDPGTYQWRIRAFNSSSETAYTTRTLLVDTAGLSNQPLIVTSPVSGYSTNSSSVTFAWQPLYGTTNYNILIDTATGSFTTGLVLNQTTPYNGYTHNFVNEGRYIWKVKATNATESSNYSGVRVIVIDRKAPTIVTLSSPALGTYPKPISLEWNASPSNDEVAKYKLYAYKVVGTDTSATPLTNYPREILTGTSYSFNDGLVGDKIVWRVKAVDQAGNESKFSLYRGFTIRL
jgi:hypothetical protein